MGDSIVTNRNKNTSPQFMRGTSVQLSKALEKGIVSPPCFCFLTDEDKKILAYVDIDNVIYELGLNRIKELEEQMTVVNEAVGDLNNVSEIIPEETGATNLLEYITSINQSVNQVTNTVSMITSDMLSEED